MEDTKEVPVVVEASPLIIPSAPVVPEPEELEVERTPKGPFCLECRQHANVDGDKMACQNKMCTFYGRPMPIPDGSSPAMMTGARAPFGVMEVEPKEETQAVEAEAPKAPASSRKAKAIVEPAPVVVPSPDQPLEEM